MHHQPARGVRVPPPPPEIRPVPLSAAFPTWVEVALLSFGGPAGQIGVMHRLVVEERKWVPEERFLHAMSYCMLLPGPEAQQLATYLGWLLHGVRGGLVAGTLFIVPGVISLLLLSVLYAGFRDTAVVQGIFYGLKPAVMAVVIEALLRIGRRTLHSRQRRWVAALAFVAIFFFDVAFPLIVFGAALWGYSASRVGSDVAASRARRPPSSGGAAIRPSIRTSIVTAAVWLAIWFLPVGGLVLLFGAGSVFVQQSVFFSKAALVTFGGAYAVLAYVAQQAVEVYQWLAPGEMLDGLGMAETTPGPLIQVVQFVGFMGAYRHPGGLSPMAAGVLGSFVTAWVTFVPCFLFVLLGAPFAESLRGRRNLAAALESITAAVVGVVLNLAVWFLLHTVFGEVETLTAGPLRLLVPDWGTVEWPALGLAVAATLAMLRLRLGMVTTLGASAAAGLLLRLVVP